MFLSGCWVFCVCGLVFMCDVFCGFCLVFFWFCGLFFPTHALQLQQLCILDCFTVKFSGKEEVFQGAVPNSEVALA